MRPRALKTTKILAVALTAAGCAESPPPPTQAAEPIRIEAAPPPTAPLASPPAPVEPAATAERPAPERAPSKDPALLALADQLASAGRERVLAEVPRYRPLCDAEGYPLVGNLNRKDARYQPSAFCSEVRKQAKR